MTQCGAETLAAQRAPGAVDLLGEDSGSFAMARQARLSTAAPQFAGTSERGQ